MQKHSIHIDGTFSFEAGGSIEGLDLVYHTSERSYAPGEKVVWICHALTANSDPTDWWPDMVGPGKVFDTDRYFVVCVNMIGSPYGSSSPASVNPNTGRPYLLDFPKVTVRDIVRGNILVREHLGIGKIDLMVGASIGGFQAVEWCVMEPELIAKTVFIATATRVSPYLTAFEESQRMALLSDQTFLEAKDLRGGEAGLRCARSIALISYRSFDGYCLTQAEKDEDCLFADRAASYQRYQGKKLSDRFDAYSYWSLSYSLDSHNLGRGRGGVEAALKTIKAQTVVICIDSDCLFPPCDMKPFADGIDGAEYHEISSRFGHDGFLLENETLTGIIEPLLK